MNKNQAEINPVDLLIITVGTRQVGWRCEDGVVRSLGSDGRDNPPPHVNELYDILEVERGYYIEDDKKIKWSVKDLGERFYKHCQEELNGDFSNVELLLDQEVIKDLYSKGLKHIILWATDQPGDVSWQHRRNDTLWLAKLMAGKIKKTYSSEIEVDVLHPKVDAGNYADIRKAAEKEILPCAQSKALNLPKNQSFVLAIENKGSTPPIAQGLIVCIAVLVRQFQVIICEPKEPDEPYPLLRDEDKRTASITDNWEQVSVSEYFWPWERSRVISAWEKGNFSEAKVWLESHTIKYGFLHDLAEYLAISSNWEFSSLIEEVNKNDETSKFEAEWLNLLTDSNKGYLTQLTSVNIDEKDIAKKVEEWRDRLKKVRADEYAETWESTFFIYVLLLQENSTGAFFMFAQTLERLLYVKYKKEPLFKKKADKVKDEKDKKYITFEFLIKALFDSSKPKQEDSRPKKKGKQHKLFHKIRDKRNDLVHKAYPMSLEELSKLWSDAGLEIDTSNPETILKAMQESMEKVIKSPFLVWNETMLYSLYKWGLDILKSEEINSQQSEN